MNYYRKIFASIFATSFGLSVLLLWFMLGSIRKDSSSQFVERYEKLADLVGHSLLEAESAAEKIGFNAAKHLSTLVSQGKIPSEEELTRLGKELDVSLFGVTDKDGRFLRDTVTGAAKQTHKIFDFCADYRKLITGGSELEVTPILPSFPYRGPYKFIMIPSPDRRFILESGVNLANIGRILANTMRTDENIRSLGLFSPTFFNFGTIYSDGRFVDGDQGQAPRELEAGDHELRHDTLEVIRKVKVSKPGCCECKIKGVKGEGDYFYLIRLEASTAPLRQLLDRAWWTAMGLGLFLFLLSSLVAHTLARRLVARLKKVDEAVRELNSAGELASPLEVGGADEVTSLAGNFNQMAQSLVRFRREQVALEKASALGEMARQVAHDIRSPLSALNTVVGSLDSLPEERRQLIRGAAQRINDIANSLLQHGRARDQGTNTPGAVELLSAVDMLVSEKRAQFRERTDLEIVPELARAFGLFARVDGAELGRAVSNLVNNAAEAIPGKGQVKVAVYPSGSFAAVEVRDDGPGIPADLLPRLAEKGVSHGKAGGSGLGLYGARQLAESAGGRLEIESKPGQGTVVRLMLPLAPAPGWFPTQITLTQGGVLVTVDDDVSIHLLWAERLKELPISYPHVVLHSPAELERWLEAHPNPPAGVLFLIDHEMPGELGASVIARLGLAGKSILVTSRSKELAAEGVADRLRLRMLSKRDAPFVPFKLAD